MKISLFTCLVEDQGDEEAFVQVYWSNAEHMGEAIDCILKAAKSNGLKNPIPRECDPYEISNLDCSVEPGIESKVFWSTSRYFFPPEPIFRLPKGIISSCNEGEYDVDDIEPGYTYLVEEDLITIEVNVDEEQLFELYKKILHLNSSYKVFWYVIHDHWDDEDHDIFLVNEKLNTPEKIIAHIEDNEDSSLFNGYVTLTSYLEDGATNISISDHKRLVVRSRSELVAARIKKLLEAEGYRRHKFLINIEYRMHHWHYRVAGSKKKVELISYLKDIGFDNWEP